jgi:hypothetical protein
VLLSEPENQALLPPSIFQTVGRVIWEKADEEAAMIATPATAENMVFTEKFLLKRMRYEATKWFSAMGVKTDLDRSQQKILSTACASPGTI